MRGVAVIRARACPQGAAFLEEGLEDDGANALPNGVAPLVEVQPGVTAFADVDYYEPWWIQILKGIVIFAIGLQLVPLVLLVERKLLGRFQARYGPNRVGPFGILQPLADIGKLLGKEQFRAQGRGRRALLARAGDLDPDRGRGLRDHPVRQRRRTSSAPTSGSTASTSASARSTSSPSAASPSTA